MSGTIGYHELRAATIRQVAQLMAAAAITAPKSGGQLFLAGKLNFMETVIADDPATRRQLAAWMRARGKERRERIWFRDADAAEAVDAILFVGLLPGWYPPNYDCGACGYATCANSSRRPNPRERRRVNARRSRPPRTDTPHRTHDRGRCPAPDAHTAPILPSAEACKRRDRLVYRADQATTETSTCPRRHPSTAPARPARNSRTCRPTLLRARRRSRHSLPGSRRLTRIYTAACPLFAVISVAGLTIWTNGLVLWWTTRGQPGTWAAADPDGAAAHLAQVAASMHP